MKPLIGITAGKINDRDHPWTPAVLGHCHTYLDSVEIAGGIPVLLPITNDLDLISSLLERLDGVMFSGGIDIHPSMYNEEPSDLVKEYSEYQDKFEIALLRLVLKSKKPMLGICRGMQLLNIEYGGTLYQDIESQLPDAGDHREAQRTGEIDKLVHNLRIDPDSKLAGILSTYQIGANSHHHQAIKRIGVGLKETAWAEDGIIEAIELIDQPFAVGVQLHPEEILEAEPKWKLLFEAFIDAAKNQTPIYLPEHQTEQFLVDPVQ